jgi:hypothetical protein
MNHQPPDHAAADPSCRRALELAAKRELDDQERGQLMELANSALGTARGAQDLCHEQQALTVVTIAHLKTGETLEAQTSAEQALALCQQNADQQTIFDRACTLAAAAKAFNAAGKPNEALGHLLQALEEADKLSEDERTLFDRLFAET